MLCDYPSQCLTNNTEDSLDVPVTPLKISHYNTSEDKTETDQNVPTQLYDQHSTTLAVMPGQFPIVQSTTEPIPLIQNIVSTCSLGVNIDLKHLALHARNAEYNPKRFSAVIMRIREPRTTALVFSSGKMVITGAKSEQASRLASRKYARIVQKLGFDVKFLDFKVQNIVGSVDVKFAIHLEALFITHNQFATYEPELFPGLIYRMVNPRVVLLIFVSGKIVITGAKNIDNIYLAMRQIYPVVKSFKK